MKMFDTFSEHVLVEILCKTSVKSLLRFTSVCRSWYALIKSPYFIYTHLHKLFSSKTKSNNTQFLLIQYYVNYEAQYSLYLDNTEFKEYMPLHVPSNCQFNRLVGSCNGVLCFFDEEFTHEIILWNPSVQKFMTLPKSNFTSTTMDRQFFDLVALGFDYNANDYKVLRMIRYPDLNIPEQETVMAELYSLKSDSWKNITHTAPKYYVNTKFVPAFVNGALHWIANDIRKSFVMAFDVREEVFREIMLPKCVANFNIYDLLVMEFGDSSIAAFTFKKFNGLCLICTWVMKEYGVEESWTELRPTCLTDRKTFLSGSMLKDGGIRWKMRTLKSTMLGIRKNGHLLMEDYPGKVVSYDLESQCTENLIALDTGKSFSAYAYVQSLALLDKGKNARDAIGTTYPSDEDEVEDTTHALP